jgi:L-ornithine N5-oxygenase
MCDPLRNREYDLIGIGFGPSNLALAIALYEYNLSASPADRLSFAFLEQQEAFGWHRGMLINDATMQIAFLKDLVTPRNPTSELSFVSYLHTKGRLAAFINHQSLFPSRREFHDYLEWAADRMAPDVSYSHRVIDVRPIPADGDVRRLEVIAARGDTGVTTVWRTRSLAVATGLTPAIPPEVTLSDRIWHSESLLHNLDRIRIRSAPTFVVVGAGQSAAEVVEHLHGRYPDGQVHAVFSRYGFSPADESPFVNAIFDPGAVNTFYHADASVKAMLMGYHSNTNYSVVDRELIHELYRRHYQEVVAGAVRLHFAHMSRVINSSPSSGGVDVAIEFLPTGSVRQVRADVVIYASGYRPVDPLSVLGSTADWCKLDSKDRLQIDLDYRVDTVESMNCQIFVVGATEYAHGLSSSLLSNAAVRAGQVVQAMVKGSRSSHSLGR